MCGFSGFLGGDKASSYKDSLGILDNMSLSYASRGPDSSGVWLANEDSIAMVHNRLAILGLGSDGSQPMTSESGRYVISFNGEIYNHQELRLEIAKSNPVLSWRSSTDTETLLACIDAFGLKSALYRLNGMFAFALWDCEEKSLSLVRDRFGEKPLYYGWQGRGREETFIFGSVLKALKCHPSFEGVVDRESLALMLRYKYVPAPFSIFQGIKKLEPGCLLTVSQASKTPTIVKYWDPLKIAEKAKKSVFRGSFSEAVDASEITISKAVQRQMLADVSLGTFLSGGVDSSLITALAQTNSDISIDSFTIGFSKKEYDEAIFAKRISNHLGTNHHELYVTAKDSLNTIPYLPDIFDEPFADSSQIPTLLLCQLAKKDVTVALSGDGGDELFCGYNRYTSAYTLWEKTRFLSPATRSLIAKFIGSIPAFTWEALTNAVPSAYSQGRLSERAEKLAKVLDANLLGDLYRLLTSTFDDPATFIIGGLNTTYTPDYWASLKFNDREKMMLLDIMSYLPGDILTKVDRASMAVSLEARVPLLDKDVISLSTRIPIDLHLYRGKSKAILREILYKHVPKKLIDRPKMGFSIPLKEWLGGPLREWCENLLNEDRLREEGYFIPSKIRKLWQDHIDGKSNNTEALWNILMFQAWLEKQ